MESEKPELSRINSHRDTASPGLSRQVTVTLDHADYERLFFQPHQAKGDLAKRLGNPTLIGLLGFLIPFSSTVFCLLDLQGANPNSLTAISGSMAFLGGIPRMNLAGLMEWVLGNTFPAAVFIVYGSHWINLAYTMNPLNGIVSSYAVGDVPGAASVVYNSGSAFYDLTMVLVTFIFFLGSLRTNVVFSMVFLCLMPFFGLVSAGTFHIGHYPTEAGIEYATYLIKIGGGFGFVTMMCGWYLAIITVCASVGLPCPLPVFDLSTKIGPRSKAAKLEHAGANQV